MLSANCGRTMAQTHTPEAAVHFRDRELHRVLFLIISGQDGATDASILPLEGGPRDTNNGLPMTDKKVWFITGAGRGLGLDIAKAALAAGHQVIATGRDPGRVTAAIGRHNDLLAIKLDVTRPDDAHAAV